MIVEGGLQRGFAQRRVARMLDAAIRQKLGVIIVGIKRADSSMEFNPPPEAVTRAETSSLSSGVRTASRRSRR